MSEKEVEKEKRPRCKKCGSMLGYYKLKEKAWQCRGCGFLDKLEVIN